MTLATQKIRLILELRRAGVTERNVLTAFERTPRDPFVPEAFAAFMGSRYEQRGVINLEIETTPDSLVLKNGRCPIYDGFKMAGLDDETTDAPTVEEVDFDVD